MGSSCCHKRNKPLFQNTQQEDIFYTSFSKNYLQINENPKRKLNSRQPQQKKRIEKSSFKTPQIITSQLQESFRVRKTLEFKLDSFEKLQKSLFKAIMNHIQNNYFSNEDKPTGFIKAKLLTEPENPQIIIVLGSQSLAVFNHWQFGSLKFKLDYREIYLISLSKSKTTVVFHIDRTEGDFWISSKKTEDLVHAVQFYVQQIKNFFIPTIIVSKDNAITFKCNNLSKEIIIYFQLPQTIGIHDFLIRRNKIGQNILYDAKCSCFTEKVGYLFGLVVVTNIRLYILSLQYQQLQFMQFETILSVAGSQQKDYVLLFTNDSSKLIFQLNIEFLHLIKGINLKQKLNIKFQLLSGESISKQADIFLHTPSLPRRGHRKTI